MSETVRVKVVGREHGRHKTGDEFEIREEVAERHPNTLEVIEAAESEPSDEPEDFTCSGNGGDCSRPVDEPGGRCWQHTDD